MSSSRSHPRRTAASPTMTASLSDSFQNLSIRKGSTFHSPTLNKSDVFNPFTKGYSFPSLPSRSATCPQTLEDLLIGAGERRAVDLLSRVDEAIAKQSALSSILREPEVLPVPRFMLENTSLSQDTLSEKHHTTIDEHAHASDSGLGSSLADSEVTTSEKVQQLQDSGISTMSSSSAITRSYASMKQDDDYRLSEFAQRQIHKHIIKPILSEPSLKEFHPLIKDVPRRIGNKDIANLRDLEKTLIFLAPDFSRSPAAYKSFCETSIRCLHLTVDGVHESDQCLPTDRPYTNHYFVDLVEQIRRYAAILAATREKQSQGEATEDMDATLDKIELVGGMSHTGKPAFLACKTGDAHISLVDGHILSPDDVAAASAKRPMDDDVFADDDGARRSMARRKKGELPKTYTCKSSGCRKEFKRPCDLTKHVKTHERPWKCPEEGCKYFDYGWPTEKERERHVNDKHSDAPSLYSCMFEGCPYTSKRESNCKQHMEKSHGWEYVRSKNNGKGKMPVTHVPKSKTSPQSTADSVMGTPFTPMDPSPSAYTLSSADASRCESMAPPVLDSMFGSPNNVPVFDFGTDFGSHFNPDYLGVGLSTPYTPAWSDDRRASAGTADSGLAYNDVSFEDAMKTEDLGASLFDDLHFQQPTPESSHNYNSAPQSGSLPVASFPSGSVAAHHTFSPEISPIGQDLAFTSPHLYNDSMQLDEGFGDGYTNQDFQLFATATNPSGLLFADQAGLDNMGSQFNYGSQLAGNNIMDLFPELKDQE